MRLFFKLIFIFAFVGLGVVSSIRVNAQVGINQVISFQGKLTNADGTNVANGLYDIVVRIYDGAGSGGSTLFTESYTNAALWASTLSSAPISGGESLTYVSNTNEATLSVGQILWNSTKQESVIVTSVNTTSNVLGISPTRQAWANSDTVTNRVYVRDGVFRLQINSVNRNWGTVDFNTQNLFMGISVGADSEMRPRLQFSATPYAQNADRLDGLDSASLLRSDTSSTVSSGTLTFNSGTTLDLNGDLSVADTNIVLDGTTTNLQVTGDFSINTDDLVVNKASGLVGINTTGADRRLDVLDASNPQLRLTYADGTVYTDFGTAANGTVTVTTQGSTGNIVFQANGASTAGVVQIGAGGSGSAVPDMLAVDVKNDNVNDPATTQVGYIYYNSTRGKFRCYEQTGWIDCVNTSGFANDSIDFEEIVDSATLDANFVVDQGTNTWTQNYTGTSGAGFTYTASGALTSGNAAYDIGITNSGTNVPGLLIRYSGSGHALRINDDGTNSDTTPIVVDALGRLGVGTVSPEELMTVGGIANRGDISVYGDINIQGMERFADLTGIVDIFIYDTSRDVDDGVWTDNGNASWYTEAKDDAPGDACNIATDDRCGSNEFPNKAILAVTASGLYIFDAKDNSLWMRFSQDGVYTLGADLNNNPSSVFALNGVIYVGMNGSAATGIYAIDFVSDRLSRYNTTNRVRGDKDISDRNTVVSYSENPLPDMAIIDNVVNDIHGTVISGSSTVIANSGPLQGVTLIAAATDTGISVINLSRYISIDYSDQTSNDYNSVFVTKRARLYALNETLAQLERWDTVDTDNVDEINGTPTDIYDETTANRPNISQTTPTILLAPDALEVVERGSFADDAADVIYIGHSLGMTELHDVNAPGTTSIGWSKFYNSSRMSSYLSGTTRGNFLFNETSGDLLDSSIANNVLEPEVAPSYGVSGVNGSALLFNGSSQFLCSDTNNDGTCDSDTDFNNGTISFHVELWFRHASGTAGEDVLVSKLHNAAGAATAGWVVWMNSAGQMRFAIDDDATWTLSSGSFDDVTSITGAGAQSYAEGQWHHLVAVNTDTAIHLFVDGVLLGSDTALAATATLDATQITTVGATCNAANCTSGANFWTGEIDDLVISANGASTSENLLQSAIRKRYLAGREMLASRGTTVTDATSFSATTIGDSSETWLSNDFTGKVVEITGGTGVGQTRKVVSNSSTEITVSPAWSVNPDASSDFSVYSERLYGATNNVTSIGVEDPNFLGVQRRVYVGTNNGTDGGGVSILNGMASILTDVYHSDSGLTDDLGDTWSGTDADDIVAIDYKSSVKAVGSGNSLFAEYRSWNLQSEIDEIQNSLAKVRSELVVDGLGGTSSEVGQLGGADLAEYFDSEASLEVGTIVSLRKDRVEWIEPTREKLQADAIGVVATNPGIILGTKGENSYPVALAGRVPVLVTDEGGIVQPGDYIGASSAVGFGMRTTGGRVVGMALEGMSDLNLVTCPEGLVDKVCHRILMLVDKGFLGASLERSSGQLEGLDNTGSTNTDPMAIMQFITETENENILTVNRGLFENLTVSNEALIKLLVVEQELRLGDTLIDKSGVRTQKLRISDTAGQESVGKGEQEKWVAVPQLSSNDLVLVLPIDPNNKLRVDKKMDGLGFSVVNEGDSNKDVEFQWWVVGRQ